jgi:hypothetical protein
MDGEPTTNMPARRGRPPKLGPSARGQGKAEELELKKRLFDSYGGFTDRRIKNLGKGDTFTIYGREATDFDDHDRAYSSLRKATVKVRDATTVDLHIERSLAAFGQVRRQAPALGGSIPREEISTLDMRVTPGELNRLEELATPCHALAQRRAPECGMRSYKPVCSPADKSLLRLWAILQEQWGSGPVASD